MSWKEEVESAMVYAILVDENYFKDINNVEKFSYAVYIKKPIILFTYDKSFIPINLIIKKIDRIKIVESTYEDLLSKGFIEKQINQFIYDLLQPIPNELTQVN